MTPEQAEALGAYLRQHRHQQRLTTRALAADVGIDMSTVVRIEQGKILRPAPDILRRLAVGLGLPPSDLFTLADYTSGDELPAPKPYLRAKYPDLPAEAIEEVDRFLAELMREHGVTNHGPAPGEDETEK
jgi:transcriptional regulator with XRE-family HTH domain